MNEERRGAAETRGKVKEKERGTEKGAEAEDGEGRIRSQFWKNCEVEFDHHDGSLETGPRTLFLTFAMQPNKSKRGNSYEKGEKKKEKT